ncbi:peptidylprolyl isomerase [bacterium]|nr:peptidylprolyl isomerase [bacterium]
MNPSRFFSISLILLCFVFYTLPTTSFALWQSQESDPTLKELLQQWQTLDGKMTAKEAELKSTTPNAAQPTETPPAEPQDREKLTAEYTELLAQAETLITKLQTQAKAQMVANPNDSEATRTLLAIMLNNAQFGRDARVLKLGDSLISQGINPQYFVMASRSERLSISARELFDELLLRHAEAKQNDLPRVRLSTTQGDIVIELYENEAPDTVGNFISLVESGYYKDRLFHRVIDGFMAQGGGFKLQGGVEVDGDGPGYAIPCECNSPEKRLHFTNCISMAHAGTNTGGAQFFLTLSRTDMLDGRHTCFGRIIAGMDVLAAVKKTHIPTPQTEQPIEGVQKDKIISAEVIRKRDHEYKPDKIKTETSAEGK